MSDPIEFYFDPISPYAYLASTQIDRLAARYGRSVDWRPVLLSVTVLQVMGIKSVPQTPLKSDYSRRDKHRMARLLGVPLVDHGLTEVSPINALRAFLWCKQTRPDLAASFGRRLCAAHWTEQADIGKVDVVTRLGHELGLDSEDLQRGMQDPAIKAGLRTAVEQAIGKGVFGTPYFIVDDEPIWGVDRLWMLEHWLEHGQWTPLEGTSP